MCPAKYAGSEHGLRDACVVLAFCEEEKYKKDLNTAWLKSDGRRFLGADEALAIGQGGHRLAGCHV